MATTNGSSTWRSPSRDYFQSNTTDNLQSNGRATLESHRGANGTGESPYSSSNVRGYVSAVDLRENVADANSAAASDSGQSSLGGGPKRLVAPRTKASKSSQPAAYVDVEPFVPDRADSVRALFSFDPRTRRDSNLWPAQHRRDAGDPAVSALYTSKSSDSLAPNGSHITQRAGGPMKRSRSIQSNESTPTVTSLPTSIETSKPSRSMPLKVPPHATTSPPTSKNTAKPSRKIVTNEWADHASDETPRGEKTGSGPPQVENAPPRGTDPNSSKSQTVNPPSLTQPPDIQDDLPLSPPIVPATSERLLAPAPGVAKTYSRQTPGTALGASQVPRGIPVVPEKPVSANESRETAPSRTKGGHEPENGQPAPINGSSPVRHSTAK